MTFGQLLFTFAVFKQCYDGDVHWKSSWEMSVLQVSSFQLNFLHSILLLSILLPNIFPGAGWHEWLSDPSAGALSMLISIKRVETRCVVLRYRRQKTFRRIALNCDSDSLYTTRTKIKG